MKKILCLVLAAVMLLSTTAFAADVLLIAPNPNAVKATTVTADNAANALHALGLLAGVGNNADGTVNFATEGSLTRAQSITQVVRFLGAEKDATSTTNAHPFTDLASWAVPYISYAYANGITAGVSATKFDGDSAMSDFAFLTAILRVLGYKDAEGDFVWNNPYDLAKSVGLINTTTADTTFTRGDAFVICYNALTAKVKSGDDVATQLIAKGLFTKSQFNTVMGIEEEVLTPVVPENPETKLLTIDKLVQKSTNGDHKDDDITTASLEINYRENVELNSALTGSNRYDNAWYPRIKQVKDDLYIMFWMYGQLGRHLYVSYSNDGKEWTAPEVFWGADNSKKITHTYGPLEGKEDQMLAVNADACVLDNGDILCVYALRPSSGYNYAEYAELNGIFMRRGTVGADNKITWSEETQVTKGQVWEPFIYQREDGQIELYWSCAIAYIDMYGFDSIKRSTCTSMVVSNDNGYTWSPATVKENHYVATRVYQEYVGDKIPYGTNEDGTPKYTEAVPYFGGQMPSVTQLYNGKALLAVEVHLVKYSKDESDVYHLSLARSDENGNWKPLELLEEKKDDVLVAPFAGEAAAPYLARFKSGEVVLSYTAKGLHARMVSPDGTKVDSKQFSIVPDAKGSWGSTEMLNSHKIAATNIKTGDKRAICITYSYLNHRTNAPKVAVNVDGYTNDWDNNTDAYFVGSETQAQINVRTAHDNDNVYFLITRADTYLTEGDTASVSVATSAASYYRITTAVDGTLTIEYLENGSVKKTVSGGSAVAKVFGTVGNNEDKDEGVVIEISVPKALVGLDGVSSYKICPSLSNQDGVGSTNDTLTGVSVFTTNRWPSVVLD